MANERVGRIRRVGPKGTEERFPTSWDYERSDEEEVEGIEGVGRAGAPNRSLDIVGVSRKSRAQIRELGTARVRITKPGLSVVPKSKKENKS